MCPMPHTSCKYTNSNNENNDKVGITYIYSHLHEQSHLPEAKAKELPVEGRLLTSSFVVCSEVAR